MLETFLLDLNVDTTAVVRFLFRGATKEKQTRIIKPFIYSVTQRTIFLKFPI